MEHMKATTIATVSQLYEVAPWEALHFRTRLSQTSVSSQTLLESTYMNERARHILISNATIFTEIAGSQPVTSPCNTMDDLYTYYENLDSKVRGKSEHAWIRYMEKFTCENNLM